MREIQAVQRRGGPPGPRVALRGAARGGGGGEQQDQKLRVCDVCGAFLSIYDSDRRLADHFGGKMHLGYMLIREKVRRAALRAPDTAREPRRSSV